MHKYHIVLSYDDNNLKTLMPELSLSPEEKEGIRKSVTALLNQSLPLSVLAVTAKYLQQVAPEEAKKFIADHNLPEGIV